MSTSTDPDLPPERRKQTHALPLESQGATKKSSEVFLCPVAQTDIPHLAQMYMKAYRGMEEYGEATTDQALLYLQGLQRHCSHSFFKAVIHGNTAGFIVCDPDWYEPGQKKVLEIHELVVDPDHQGYGLGGLFMRFARAMGRKHGRTAVSLWAGEGNHRAISWYTLKHGFEPGRRDGIWIHFQSSIQPMGWQ
ncbi:MAG: GNAT family N-acetyltransferase [Desulfohalobiaceae bacterium]|nr:GNAT family N-acetyltransferase [Desulfohalobiaceae bacterium]